MKVWKKIKISNISGIFDEIYFEDFGQVGIGNFDFTIVEEHRSIGESELLFLFSSQVSSTGHFYYIYID